LLLLFLFVVVDDVVVVVVFVVAFVVCSDAISFCVHEMLSRRNLSMARP
jgi:hypothetical protein